MAKETSKVPLPRPGEPGSSVSPLPLESLQKAPKGSSIVGLSLGGVPLWKEGEDLSPEEMDARVTRGMLALRQRKGSA